MARGRLRLAAPACGALREYLPLLSFASFLMLGVGVAGYTTFTCRRDLGIPIQREYINYMCKIFIAVTVFYLNGDLIIFVHSYCAKMEISLENKMLHAIKAENLKLVSKLLSKGKT